MSQASDKTRQTITHALDALEMISFNQGFEAAVNAIDELSNKLHNDGDHVGAEALRWTVKELLGENA